MSELRRKKERASAQIAKEKLRESNWWNTSSGLKEACPGIENSPLWSNFAKEYDKSEHEENRLKEWLVSRVWKGLSPTLIDLIDLAEEATEETDGAGKELGLKLLDIIKGGKEFRDFVEGVKLRNKRESGVSEAVWALKCLVERGNERKKPRLPTRDELNQEAYRIRHLKVKEIPLAEWHKTHSKLEVFKFGHRLGDERIYWMEFDNEAALVRVHTYTEREGARKEFCWTQKGSTFCEILGKAGLRGLE